MAVAICTSCAAKVMWSTRRNRLAQLRCPLDGHPLRASSHAEPARSDLTMLRADGVRTPEAFRALADSIESSGHWHAKRDEHNDAAQCHHTARLLRNVAETLTEATPHA